MPYQYFSESSSKQGAEMETVGDRLDYAMRNAGIKSQSALAVLAGVPQPTIARILKNSGKGAPEAATIKKLASACRVSFNWLNEGIQDAHPPALSANELEWLNLLDYLGQDDIGEFKGLIRERQERNKRLLKEFEAPPENPNGLRNT